jgi:hypothetical protein
MDWAAIHVVVLIMVMTMMTRDKMGEPQDELVFPCCLFKKSSDLDSESEPEIWTSSWPRADEPLRLTCHTGINWILLLS